MFSLISEIGQNIIFCRKIFQVSSFNQQNLEKISDQIWQITKSSFPTTIMAGFFVGAILAVQFSLQLREFNALGYLGGISTSATFREIGPLLIAFMLSGKVGAFTSAELGTMKVTEQIDALRCLGADPFEEVIMPRFFGIIIASVFLLVGGLLMSIFGGAFLGYFFAGVNPEEYLRHIHTFLVWPSILGGLIKCVSFAFIIALVCTFNGYNTSGGARGVGRAVLKTAVSSMITIVVFDWVTSLVFDSLIVLVRGFR